MTQITLDLRPFFHLTEEQFNQLCGLHPELRIERNKEGELIIMPPTGGWSGNRNSKLTTRLELWAEADGTGLTFDSSTEFRLPNGGDRSQPCRLDSIRPLECLDNRGARWFSSHLS